MKNKIVAIFLLTATAITSNISIAFANEPIDSLTKSNSETYSYGETVVEKGEILEWRYMTFQGVEYKRRWSLTNNCWYDPYWIPV